MAQAYGLFDINEDKMNAFQSSEDDMRKVVFAGGFSEFRRVAEDAVQ